MNNCYGSLLVWERVNKISLAIISSKKREEKLYGIIDNDMILEKDIFLYKNSKILYIEYAYEKYEELYNIIDLFKNKIKIWISNYKGDINKDVVVINYGIKKNETKKKNTLRAFTKLVKHQKYVNGQNEMKNESKGGIKNEIKNEMKNESKGRIKSEMKNEMRNEPCDNEFFFNNENRYNSKELKDSRVFTNNAVSINFSSKDLNSECINNKNNVLNLDSKIINKMLKCDGVSFMIKEINKFNTKMGKRYILKEINAPPTDLKEIILRQKEASLFKDITIIKQIQEILKGVPDIEKIILQLQSNNFNYENSLSLIETKKSIDNLLCNNVRSKNGIIENNTINNSISNSIKSNNIMSNNSLSNNSISNSAINNSIKSNNIKKNNIISNNAISNNGISNDIKSNNSISRLTETTMDSEFETDEKDLEIYYEVVEILEGLYRLFHSTEKLSKIEQQSTILEIIRNIRKEEGYNKLIKIIKELVDENFIGPETVIANSNAELVKNANDEYLDLARTIYKKNVSDLQTLLIDFENQHRMKIYKDKEYGLCLKCNKKNMNKAVKNKLNKNKMTMKRKYNEMRLKQELSRSNFSRNSLNYSKNINSLNYSKNTLNKANIKSDSFKNNTSEINESTIKSTELMLLKNYNNYMLFTSEEIQLYNYKCQDALNQIIEISGKKIKALFKRNGIDCKILWLLNNAITKLDFAISNAYYSLDHNTIFPKLCDSFLIENYSGNIFQYPVPCSYNIVNLLNSLVIKGPNGSGKHMYASLLVQAIVMAQLGYGLVATDAHLIIMHSVHYVDTPEDLLNFHYNMCFNILVIIDEVRPCVFKKKHFEKLFSYSKIFAVVIARDKSTVMLLEQFSNVVFKTPEYAHSIGYYEIMLEKYLPNKLVKSYNNYRNIIKKHL